MGLEQEQPKKKLNNKFESFGEPLEEQGNKLFVNAYRGHYFQNMEFNRRVVERTLRLAHLDSQVFLTSLPLSKSRSLDGVNSDGSTPVKKFLIWGEKLDEEKDNPYYRVRSIPQGWKIEINDQRIMEELLNKRIDPEKSQRQFIKKFNNLTTISLVDCIVKEKLSSIKDLNFRNKLFWSLFGPLFQFSFQVAISTTDSNIKHVIYATVATSIANAVNNYINQQRAQFIAKAFRGSYGIKIDVHGYRKLDHTWEYILPMVEIDKVIESWFYLNVAGQKLVREKR